MGVVALGSVRSCGVTTLATALAATWPAGRKVLLVEADPAGGTLAGASGWPSSPNLVSLAAAARRAGGPELVWDHCQHLPGGGFVLAGAASTEQTKTALGMLGTVLGGLGELDCDVLVDCGRLGDDPTIAEVMRSADRVVLAVRPRVADLHALMTWLDTHGQDRVVEVVTVGDGAYPDGEIAEAVGVEVVARLPWDPGAAQALVAVPASARELRMALLVRAARSLADQLAAAPAALGVVQVGPGEDRLGEAAVRSPLAGRFLRRGWRTETLAATNGTSPSGSDR